MARREGEFLGEVEGHIFAHNSPYTISAKKSCHLANLSKFAFS
jgi:hypothetical protein